MDQLAPLTDCTPRLDGEAERLALLHTLELLDTPADPTFDAFTGLAAHLTGMPIALIGLVDAERTWFKSRVGMDSAQSPREISFCHFAIAGSDVFQVPDSHADARFQANPLVTGTPHVRAYAGVPLRVAGLPMGTLCVIDHQPRQLDAAQLDALRLLGRLATEQLEQRLASRAKSALFAQMNHEMRTPLNAILGFGQLLLLQAEPGSVAERQLRHVVEAGRHLLEVVIESLDLMRLDTGTDRAEPREVELVALAAQTLEMLRPVAEGRGAVLQQQLPPSLCVLGDERRIRQVLLNLLGHAIRNSPPGGQVLLCAGTDADGAPTTSVTDEGPAPTPEQVGQLSRPVERPGPEHGTVAGTGPGLALAAHLVAAMGGRIDVRSEAGRGCTSRVRWPACAAAPQAAMRASADCIAADSGAGSRDGQRT